jgi:uncharacterized damage-inducible protein DinB
MSIYGGKELAAAFRTVRGNTIQIAEEIPENQYNFRSAPESRSIGQLLAHIALIPMFSQLVHGGKLNDLGQMNFPEFMQKMSAEEARVRSKAEVVALLKSEGESFAAFLEGLSDPFLAEGVKMPPGLEPATKSRFEMLLAPKEHEMHHRGQLMLLERMIGLVPHLTRRMHEHMAQTAPAR